MKTTEAERTKNSNIFEGIVSFRAVIDSILSGKSDRKILKVMYSEENLPKKSRELGFIKAKSCEMGFELDVCKKDEIDKFAVGTTHGGLVFFCSDRTYGQIGKDDIVKNGFYVMLEGVEDPYNFGYALRTLYSSGVDGVLLTKRNWLGAAGVVCRSSAGASEACDIFVAEEGFIELFKEKGYKIIAADMPDSVPVYDADLTRPLVLLIGGEKRGISAPLLEKSDTIVRIEYGREFKEALSVASAASVLSYEVYRQNRKK